ncbi:MAG: PIN domain-containing protein [Acidobacteriia bacterium]|nr:PIN domain-containing protein [Terriglobia bacterium]
MTIHYAVKAHYLDASALVKLVADDADEMPGRDVLREYYHSHSNRYATSYCVAETLSASKLKFVRGLIAEEEYIRYVRDFIDRIIGANLQIDEVPILSTLVSTEAERLIQKYKIDFIDCFQIVTILYGQFRHLGPDSKSILITADRRLAKVARAEGARVWECTSEPAPQ